MNNEEKRDMIITEGLTIKQWFDYNIQKHGAKKFFDYLNIEWDENTNVQNSIKKALLYEIKTKMKPETINTIEDLAKLLDGNEYGNELYNEYKINVYELCKKNKWVIIFGASDDLIEFEGFVSDENGAWNGTLMKFIKPGDFYLEDEDNETYKRAKNYSFVPIDENELKEIKNKDYKDNCVIEMLWCPEGTDMSWQVNVKGVPFTKFNVMEDEEIYCEAAIIDLSNFIK